ncbi:MAG: serine/threonine protein kinase, partial [Gemmatimonadales bacterium]|nr:serine/threonine protein kinase [Gemmatimonadales bacterium]
MTIPDRLTAALSDRYRIERELGQGGMATVYLAQDLKHDRQVAIKVLHPDLGATLGGERFLSEIRTTARLQHPHILPLLDSGTADGLLYYVMPLMTGETLRARLERERQLPVDDALRIAREVADALGHAHEQGIIHRDIKPENILLQGGHAVVADFGIALAVQTAGGQRMTQTGLSLGTPHYMSPEQAMGERSIDARSDIYALGAVTYEMLAGEPPFTGPTVQAIVARVMSEEPRSLVQQRKAVSPMVEDTVLRALEKLPADRFATAAEYSAALGAGADGGTRATRAWPTAPGTRPGMSMVTAAAVVLGIAALWGWLRPTPVPAVIRYRLAVDSVQVLRLWSGELAISPDGSILAYAGGVNSPLMVRRRDGLDFQPMDGTGGAASPFFSPDGTQLGYFQNGKLMVAPLAGGPPVVYDDSLTTPEGAAWTEAGTILRAWKDSLGVFSIGQMVAAPGARVTPLTTVDTAAGETSHLLPEALPGKNGVLFQVAFRGGRRAIGVTGLAGGQHAILFDGDRARYARSGHLVYSTTDGSLWAVPFDAGARRVTGSPTQVGGGLPGTMVGPVNFAVSETGTLVHALETPTTRNELVWVTRGGHRTPFDTAWRAAFASPRLSPDG